MSAAEGHLSREGFEAWVLVDDKPLPVFGVEYKDATREAMAWIPSEEGKAFSVCHRKIQNPPDDKDFTACIQLDGQQVSYVFYDRYSLGVKEISYIDVSPTETRDFVFNAAELTDDDAFLKNPSATRVGEIKVTCVAVQKVRETYPKVYMQSLEPEKIHERAKKGIVHQIKYSETKSRPFNHPRCAGVAPLGNPVTFVFKYRPLGVLQAMGIAPRPTPVESRVDEDEDEAREQELLAELEKVRKRKRAGRELDRERSLKRVKTEPTEAKFRPEEVIDLTQEPKPVERVVIDLT